MTGQYALDLVTAAHGWLCDNGPTRDICLDPHAGIGDGSTIIMDDGPHVSVGIADILENPDVEFRDGEALLPFVALFHEVAGHAMQFMDEFHRTRTLSKVLFLSHCACEGSQQYYGIDDNGIPHGMYFAHPHEIAAQYMGIKCAAQCLECVVGHEKAEAMICDYVAYRREKGCEFLQGDVECKTVGDILSAMNCEFRKRIEEHRNFTPDRESVDVLYVFDAKRPKFDAFAAVCDCANGLRQDSMMACAFFDSGDDLRIRSVNTLRNMEVYKAVSIEPKKAFIGKGCPVWPPPTRAMSNLERLRSITDEIDRDEITRQCKFDFER